MTTEPTIQMVSIELIIPNRFQPRLTFDEQSLNELSSSIKEHGIIQPLILRRLGDKYEIIAGERRYKAATIAGLTEVPAIISDLDDNRSAEIALVENVQRKDLSAIEEAKSYKKMLDKGHLTQEQLAQKIGVSQSAVANKLRLLNLNEDVQEALMNNKISERHARSLLQVNNPEEQTKMLFRIINERLTVRNLDLEIKKITAQTVEEPKKEEIQMENNPVIEPLEQTTFNSPVNEVIPSSVPGEDVKLETLEVFDSNNNMNSNVEDIKEKAPDVIPSLADKMLNLFEKGNSFPSLEDEVVNMNPGVPGFIPVEEEKEEVKETPKPEIKEKQANANKKPKKEEVRIKKNDLPNVSAAYKLLEKEVREAGYAISSEEFDFEDLYQIIIKIDKTGE